MSTGKLFTAIIWGGRVVRRCHIAYITGGVQLILAYSWARPATLVAGKGRGGMFLFLLFLHFHSCSSFFPVPLFLLLYYLFSFLPFSGRRHKMTHKGWPVVKPQLNQILPLLMLTPAPALVAQLDANPTGDQEVVGLTPSGQQLEIDQEIFSAVILSLLLIQKGQLSVSGKNMCTILVRQHSFVKIDHEIFSTVIFSLLLNQKG